MDFIRPTRPWSQGGKYLEHTNKTVGRYGSDKVWAKTWQVLRKPTSESTQMECNWMQPWISFGWNLFFNQRVLILVGETTPQWTNRIQVDHLHVLIVRITITLCKMLYIYNMCIPGPSKGCQMVPKGCQFTIP